MARSIRFGMSLIACVALSVAVSTQVSAAPAPQTSPDGAVYTFATGPSGEAVLTVDAGELHVEKSVLPNGSTALLLRVGSEELRLEVTTDRVSLATANGTSSFVPGGADDREAVAVRVALARSRAVEAFRQAAARVSARGGQSPFEEALALSGALVGQLSGDPGALRGFNGRHRPVKGAVRPVSARRIEDCWGQYENFILWAWDQYLWCLSEGRLRFFGVSYCEAQYYMRAESAWFQFLACSAIPVK